METVTVEGRDFVVTIEPDYDNSPPWEQEDGHGPVSEWTRRDKRPGERILSSDRESHRYYDVAEVTEIARRDGWGAPPYDQATTGLRAAAAVEADYKRLRAWCAGDWYYAVVGVRPLNEDGNPYGETDYLGGVESDYAESSAVEMAMEIIAREIEEAGERAYAVGLGVRTVA